MPQWKEDQRNYNFPVAGERHDTKIHVAGVREDGGQGRSKLILADRADNLGASVAQDTRAAQACVQGILNLAEGALNPESVEWFVRGQDGEIYGIDFKFEQDWRDHSSFTAVVRDDDHAEQTAVKKLYPDIPVFKVSETLIGEIPESSKLALLRAFGDARSHELSTMEPKPDLSYD